MHIAAPTARFFMEAGHRCNAATRQPDWLPATRDTYHPRELVTGHAAISLAKDGWPLTDDGPFLGSATPTLSIDAATPTNQGEHDVSGARTIAVTASAPRGAWFVASPRRALSCDTNVRQTGATLADTDPFVEVLLDPTAWTYPCTRSSADCNDSGAATFADIDHSSP